MNPYSVILEAEINGEPLPPEVTTWVKQLVLNHYQRDLPAGQVLDRFKRSLKYTQRDQALCDAYQLVGDLVGLKDKLERFEKGRWPIWKERGIGDNADELAIAMYTAFSTGLLIPKSTKQLKAIVEKIEPNDFPDRVPNCEL